MSKEVVNFWDQKIGGDDGWGHSPYEDGLNHYITYNRGAKVEINDKGKVTVDGSLLSIGHIDSEGCTDWMWEERKERFHGGTNKKYWNEILFIPAYELSPQAFYGVMRAFNIQNWCQVYGERKRRVSYGQEKVKSIEWIRLYDSQPRTEDEYSNLGGQMPLVDPNTGCYIVKCYNADNNYGWGGYLTSIVMREIVLNSHFFSRLWELTNKEFLSKPNCATVNLFNESLPAFMTIMRDYNCDDPEYTLFPYGTVKVHREWSEIISKLFWRGEDFHATLSTQNIEAFEKFRPIISLIEEGKKEKDEEALKLLREVLYEIYKYK